MVLAAIEDKKLRIEVGYGLEGVIPDGTAGQIRDQAMLPYFKKGNYSKGLTEGTLQILQLLSVEYKVDLGVGKPPKRRRRQSSGGGLLGGLIKLILFIVVAPFLFKSGLWVFFLPGFGGGWSGRGGGGGFGGGFGGFGGGMSGGGGASGSW